MKLNVNSPSYVLTFAAVVSALFTGAIMTLNAVSEQAATAAQQLYEEKSLVIVFELGKDSPQPLSDEKIRQLYKRHISHLDKPLKDPQTGMVFNDPQAAPGPNVRKTYRAVNDKGEIIGYALPVSGTGFWSQIDGFLAVTPDMTQAIGIVFVRHQETPGLGGRITEPKWRQQFQGLDITKSKAGQHIFIGGDKPEQQSPRHGHYVDSITGATGTSMAVERFLNSNIPAFRRAAEAAGLIGEGKGQGAGEGEGKTKNSNAENAEDRKDGLRPEEDPVSSIKPSAISALSAFKSPAVFAIKPSAVSAISALISPRLFSPSYSPSYSPSTVPHA